MAVPDESAGDLTVVIKLGLVCDPVLAAKFRTLINDDCRFD